ncbi:MAG: 1-deoxy-D-xylulose-5-phosphate synthase, partial [Clostridia bacterium]|nr:1-deoxy-D-xylulose-5-phosphate synthase [Clostridia bacterium]
MKFLDKIESPADLKKLSFSQLELLSAEIRQFLIEKVSKTGGHLASNLGVVELTVALHYVFNSPLDSFVFDVGHQSYVHKMLTGRKDGFSTLRQFEGLSGFPKKSESKHDKFNSGHSSNSISVALGIAEANRLLKNDNHAIAVIGDGALTGGLAYEALNNAGRSKSNLIVLLNDNEMSISHNVGSMTGYLTDLRTKKKYTDFKANLKQFLNKSETGVQIEKMLSKTKSGLKHLLLADTLFEALGFTYIGPLDGHDIFTLCTVLERAKHMEKPVFIHTYTKKGKGYAFAEKAPNLYHGTGPFDPTKPLSASNAETYSKISGDTIFKMAQKDEKIVAVSAAMAEPTGLLPFAETFPERFFDVGISEAHAVTFSSGLADNGFFPVISIYSTFMQRAYDSVAEDLAQQGDLKALL